MYENDAYTSGFIAGNTAADRSSNSAFGDNWAWWIIILLIFGGWGNNGWGNGGSGMLSGALTRGELCQDMNFNDLQSGVRGLSQGICDSTFALNNTITNGFAGVQQTLCQGFNGVNTGLMQQGYETRLGINGVANQLSQCCCDLRAGQADIKYTMAKDTCDITNAINNATQQVIGYLTQEKISALQSENAALTSQLSQNSQTQTIINAIRPVATPAYITCSPYESVYGYNRQSGCCA